MSANQNDVIQTSFNAQTLHDAVRETLVLGQAFVTHLNGPKAFLDPTTMRSGASFSDECLLWDDQGRAVFRLDNPFTTQKEPCASRDWTIIIVLFVLVFGINWTVRWFLWQPLANAVARWTGHKSWHDVDTARKFAMNATQATFFGFCSWASYRLIIVHESSWLIQPDAWFHTSTASQDIDTHASDRVSPALKFYFLLYFARIASDWVSLHLEMVGRSADDFFMFWCHHIVTMGLLYTAMTQTHDYFLTGCVLLAFFDWADVPLLAAKAIKYLSSHPQDMFQWTANRLFEVFAVVFFVSRNLMFGYVVHACWSRVEPWPPRLLLLALFGMQLYWMGLIVWAAWRMATHDGVVEDVRELHHGDGYTKKQNQKREVGEWIQEGDNWILSLDHTRKRKRSLASSPVAVVTGIAVMLLSYVVAPPLLWLLDGLWIDEEAYSATTTTGWSNISTLILEIIPRFTAAGLTLFLGICLGLVGWHINSDQ